MKQTEWYLKYLKIYRNYLTKQQISTLKGQALGGNIIAVRKGLATILNRQGIKVSLGQW